MTKTFERRRREKTGKEKVNSDISTCVTEPRIKLPVLQPGDDVWVRDQDLYGTIVERTPQSRSYLVSTPKGTVRRNRSALVTVENRERQCTSSSTDVQTPGNHPVTPNQRPESTCTAVDSDRQSSGNPNTVGATNILPPIRLDL